MNDQPKQRNILKSIVVYCTILVFIVVLLDPRVRHLLFPARTEAAGGYNATDVLGQVDGLNTPFFTTGAVGNVPNARGTTSADGTALDDVHHRLFILDDFNNRVLVYNLDSSNTLVDHVADFVLGQPDFKHNAGGRTQNTLDSASTMFHGGVAYDSIDDRLFVVDKNNNRVMVFNTATITNGMNAVNVLGQTDFTSNAGNVITQNSLSYPNGIVYASASKTLYVSEGSNQVGQGGQRVMVWDLSGGITDGMNAAHVLGEPDFTTANFQIFGDSSLTAPEGMALDAANHLLYVADFMQIRVMVFDVTAITDGEPAVHVLWSPDFTGNGRCVTACASGSNGGPLGLAYDPTGHRLFVSDPTDYRILVFDVSTIADGESAVNVLGQANFTDHTLLPRSTSALDGAWALMFDDGNNRLYAADWGSHMPIFDTTSITDNEPAVDMIGDLDEFDQPVFTADGIDNAPGPQGFNTPSGVAIDTVNHRAFVSDKLDNRVMVFNLDSNDQIADRTADFVLGQPNVKTITAGTTQSKTAGPAGLALDAARNLLFVADSGNNRVLVYDVATPTNGMAASFVIGQADFTSNTAGLTSKSLDGPTGLAFDAATNRLFVADTNNSRVLVFDATASSAFSGGPALGEFGQPDFVTNTPNSGQNGLSAPQSVILGDGVLFVADTANNRILTFNPASYYDGNSELIQPNALNVLGEPDFSTVWGGTDQQTVNGPRGLGFDSSGHRLLVNDTSNNRILMFDVGTITDGEPATDVAGQNTFVSGASGTTRSTLSGPIGTGIYMSATKQYFVADSANNRVMVFDLTPPPTPNPHAAVDVIGQRSIADAPVFTTNNLDNNASTSIDGFNGPSHSAIDTIHHRLFVSDTGNNRVLVFALDGSDHVISRKASYVLGQPDYDTVTSGLSATKLFGPEGIAYDSVNNRLFVSDSSNSRVVSFDVRPGGSAPSTACGVSTTGIANGMSASCVLGKSDFVGGGGSGFFQNQLNVTDDLAMDVAGQMVFVADVGSGHARVMVFDVSPGTIANGENASNVLCHDSFTTVNPLTADASHCQPNGLAIAPGIGAGGSTALLVSDSIFRHRVLEFDLNPISNGMAASVALGQPNTSAISSYPAGQNTIGGGRGISYDAIHNRLYVVDQSNNRVLTYEVGAGLVNQQNASHVLGQTDFTSSAGGVGQSQFQSFFYGVTYSPTADELFVDDGGNNRTAIFNVSSISDGQRAYDVLGQYSFTSNFPNASMMVPAPNGAGIYSPGSVALDTVHHRLFAVDSSNNRVLIFPLDATDALVSHTATLVLGQPDLNHYLPAASESATTLEVPLNTAYDSVNDRLFVSDFQNSRVLVYTNMASASDGMAATYVLGQPSFNTRTPATSKSALNFPAGLGYDETGERLFVSDYSNNRVVVYDVRPSGAGPIDMCANGTTTTGIASGMNASCVIGQTNFTGNGANTTAGGLYGPDGIAYDAANDRIFVADGINNRVTVYDVRANGSAGSTACGITTQGIADGMSASCVLGQSDLVSGGAQTSRAGLNGPASPVLDTSSGILYVADYNNNRVIVYDVNPGTIANGLDAADAYGQTSYTTATSGTTDSTFRSPYGLAFNSTTATLYAPDVNNNRILVFGAPAPTPTPTATPAAGGHSYIPPAELGFFPDKILINDDQSSTDSKNVLVSVYAHYGPDFTGTVDVLLSNTPDFAATIPFRYTISAKGTNTAWPKTIAWDLCFGLPSTTPCNPGNKTVYARFYVNLPDVWPALTPLAPLENIIR